VPQTFTQSLALLAVYQELPLFQAFDEIRGVVDELGPRARLLDSTRRFRGFGPNSSLLAVGPVAMIGSQLGTMNPL
jgi:hypothetical protein